MAWLSLIWGFRKPILITLGVLAIIGGLAYVRHVFADRERLKAEAITQAQALKEVREDFSNLKSDIARRDQITRKAQVEIATLHTQNQNLKQLLKDNPEDCPVSPSLRDMLHKLHEDNAK